MRLTIETDLETPKVWVSDGGTYIVERELDKADDPRDVIAQGIDIFWEAVS